MVLCFDHIPYLTSNSTHRWPGNDTAKWQYKIHHQNLGRLGKGKIRGTEKKTYNDNYMGVSLNGGTPISHPKMIIFSKTHDCWVPAF